MKRLVTVMVLFMAFGSSKAQTPTPTPTPTPVAIHEQVVVISNRLDKRIEDTPASVVTISREAIGSSAAPTLDDVLRQTAGFSIFRRSSSRNANPTTQGVSLRGVGASGASRTTVMFDGVPMNDPFGGWVQWNRVSPVSVERVEVLRGGASSLYGDAGLSGAINILPRQPRARTSFTADIFGGTQSTFSGALFAGLTWQRWFLDSTVSSFQTEGYVPIEEPVRGPVDSAAGVRSSNFSGTIGRRLGERGTVFFRGSYFGEVRGNGTRLQTNRTHQRQFVFGGDVVKSNGITANWRLYGGTQVYDQVFSVVTTDRTTEAVNRLQRVPVQSVGFVANINKTFRYQVFLAGLELRNVRGASDESVIVSSIPTSLVGSGGRQNARGFYVQDFITIRKKMVFAVSMRYDLTQDCRALTSAYTFATGQRVTSLFSDRSEALLSPRVSVLYNFTDQFSLYLNTSKSFRSPTLNELYRAFRVGNVLTLANENLRAERANNAEFGATFRKKSSFIRAVLFLTLVDDPVANVTLSATTSLITRQRQNVGQTISRGTELEAERHFKKLSVSGSYFLADSEIRKFPGNPALEGLKVPQVAHHQFTAQASYTQQRWVIALQGRGSSSQFDDDLNLFRLEPYAQLDVFVSRGLGDRVKIYGAVENILNLRYSIGKTPARTVSSPINVRLGLRFK